MRRPGSGLTSSTSGDGPLPVARDRAAVLASEGEDLQAVVVLVADEYLLVYHHQPARMVEQRQTKPVARLHRLGVKGDDLVLLGIVIVGEYAEEPTGRKDRGVDVFIWICVGHDHGAVVGEAGYATVRPIHIKELLAGGNVAKADRQLEAGAAAHVATKNVHRGAGAHYQLVAVRYHSYVKQSCAEQVLREVERHLSQATPALARCLPAVRPLRAHGGRRAILQLQRRQQVWHQVTREQHSLDRPLRQRLVRCKNGVGPVLDIGRRLAPCGREFQEL
eukprot:scaffold3677_cov58-Phaeocystis_antarctica.AAC.2